jgi:P-type Mg2+ transporter
MKQSTVFELGNILFMGTSVVSGSGVALVLRTGDGKCNFEEGLIKANNNSRCIHCHYHEAAQPQKTLELISARHPTCDLPNDCLHVSAGPRCKYCQTPSRSTLLTRQVLVISGKVTGNWGQAALFSVSVAVGLVPEMLPAIVNANLARGAFALARKKAIVKRLDSIQNLGGMTVLCSDKVKIILHFKSEKLTFSDRNINKGRDRSLPSRRRSRKRES